MKLELCDLCGHGMKEDTPNLIILTNFKLTPPSREYTICQDCADKMSNKLTQLAQEGKLKRDKVMAVAINAMDELY